MSYFQAFGNTESITFEDTILTMFKLDELQNFQ